MARDHSGKRLPPHIFEAASWEAMRAKMFDHCLSHMEKKATYVGEPRQWSVSEDEPSLNDFETFISIKMGRNPFKPTSNALAQKYLQDHLSRTFTVIVFKWGNHLNNAADLQQFQEQCIQVPLRDRAGAAAEAMHQLTVSKLKETWSHIFRAYEATWRLWAYAILKKPLHQHDGLIQQPPPSHMLHLFERVGQGGDERLEQLQQNLYLSGDVVQSCLNELVILKEAVCDVSRRLDNAIKTMDTKKRMIAGVLADIQPSTQAYDPLLQSAIHLIPNTVDIDHIEE
ncbi:hypothetical protein Ae201684_018588 [Aphanomyces euteiches]|uniref:Uncharacterized protein n=1 Tax=Aphanomyces euteiches TaxID=100861 RepID=A0A6G0W573_9STRA|nr:hypothetical protein Ae201684_018588 [Aphanomyces euteiches]